MRNPFKRFSSKKSRRGDAAEGSNRGELDLNVEAPQDDAPQDDTSQGDAMQDDTTECYIPVVAATDLPGPSSYEIPQSYDAQDPQFSSATSWFDQDSSGLNYNPLPFTASFSPNPEFDYSSLFGPSSTQITPLNPTPTPPPVRPPSQRSSVARNLNLDLDLDFAFENVPTQVPLSFPSHPPPSSFPSQPSPSFFPSQPSPSFFPSQPSSSFFPSQPSPSFFPSQPSPSFFPSQPSTSGAAGAGPSRAEGFDKEAGPSNTPIAYEGGPQDPSILVSYETHVAKTIWEDQSRAKLIKIQTRYRVKEWSNILRAHEGEHWVEIARRSELTHIQDWEFREADEALISAFVERWYPETNSFHLPGGEISITLHDVHTVCGLRMSGMKAHVSNFDAKVAICEMYRMYGMTPDRLKTMLKGQSVKQHKWRQYMEELLQQVRQVPPELIAVGYLFELVGSTLFVNKSGESLPLFAFGFVCNPDVTQEYAWSAATLAYLYRQLGMASRADVSQIGGCLYLLNNFIWSYFSSLRGHINYAAQRAGELYIADRSRNRQEAKLIYYRRLLDRTRVEHITWMPWRKNFDFIASDFRFSRYRGTIACQAIREAYHPDRLSRQFGWHQSIPPRDVIRPHSFKRERFIDLNTRYEVLYNQEDDRWVRREHELVPIGTRASPSYAMDEEYLEWHLRHTHPYLIHGSVDEVNIMPHPAVVDQTILANGPSIALVLNEYRNAEGRVVDARLGDAIRQMADLFLGPSPPPPIPPLPSRGRRRTSIDPARHSDAGCYR